MALTPRHSGRIEARAHHSPSAALLRKIEPFFVIGQVSGGPLAIASILALVLVNGPFGGTYVGIWDQVLRISYGDYVFAKPLAEWINDALMPLFFLIIGTEVKKEFANGSLTTVGTAALPVAGAIGGLIVPVAIYLALNLGTEFQSGWGIVAAMDTAFSLAIVGMFTTRLPASVRGVLLAFAAIDDVFGLLVIAIAYTTALEPWYLFAAGIAYLSILGLQRMKWAASAPYVVLGLIVWIGVLGSGVHPTIAGVAVGLLLPASSRLSGRRFAQRVQRPVDEVKEAQAAAEQAQDPEAAKKHEVRAERGLGYIQEMAAATDQPADRLIRILTPWVSYLVLPLFALANVRIVFSPSVISEAVHSPLALGIILGLVVGKPLGFMSAVWLAVRLRAAQLSANMDWTMLLGVGTVAGIGFTLSLFISELAFAEVQQTEQASLAILAASVMAAIIGYVVFWRAAAKNPAATEQDDDAGG